MNGEYDPPVHRAREATKVLLVFDEEPLPLPIVEEVEGGISAEATFTKDWASLRR